MNIKKYINGLNIGKNFIPKARSILSSPEKVFVILALVFGGLMVFVMPLFMAPDESAHFYRAYEISEGHLVSKTKNGLTGDYMPAGVNHIIQHDFTIIVRQGGHPPQSYWEYYTQKINLHQQEFTDFRSSALYSPVSYIPQSIGIGIGRLAYGSVGVMIVLGRLCNLAVYILLIYLAIKIARQGKWVYAVVGLFPVAIQQAASLSSDVMTIGLSLVFISFVQRIFVQRQRLSRQQLLILLCLGIGLALTKQTNIILLLPILFLPVRLFGSTGKKAKVLALVGGISIIALLGWYAALQLGHFNLQISGAAGVNQHLQMSYVVHHPLSYVATLLRTYADEGFHSNITPDFLITSMYGVFSWIAYKLPLSLITLGYATLLLVLLYDEKGVEAKSLKKLPLIQATTFILSIIAIASALYLTWTAVGSPVVWGLQGRYFIPIIPLLIPIFVWFRKWLKVSIPKKEYLGGVVMGTSIINLTSMLVLTFLWFHR